MSEQAEHTRTGREQGEPCLACGHAAGHADWCGDVYLSQERVEVHGARCIPKHMLDKPMLGAYRDPDYLAVKAWKPTWKQLPRLSKADREWVADRIIALAAEGQARSDAHRERIRRTAARLGHQVRTHQVALGDADRRIDRLLVALDPETAVPILMVPFKEAKAIATDAFEATFKGHAHG